MVYKYSKKAIENAYRWKKNNPEKVRKLRVRTKARLRYGLTPERIEEIAVAQDRKCLGCKRECPLCVDHCHVTGKVRGLLCRRCNASIGMAGESLENLENLVAYLKLDRDWRGDCNEPHRNTAASPGGGSPD